MVNRVFRKSLFVELDPVPKICDANREQAVRNMPHHLQLYSHPDAHCRIYYLALEMSTRALQTLPHLLSAHLSAPRLDVKIDYKRYLSGTIRLLAGTLSPRSVLLCSRNRCWAKRCCSEFFSLFSLLFSLQDWIC